jgi:serine/threonine protein kinase
LKESNHKDEQQCWREAENSQRLREAMRQNPNIIRYYGAYIHGLSCNIILEYADSGTLECFLMDTRPPSSPEEIRSFWSSILQLINALQGLHHIDNIKFPDESYEA